ncbi:4588_t:CDS:1, partial [Rhizophagus irregularis]
IEFAVQIDITLGFIQKSSAMRMFQTLEGILSNKTKKYTKDFYNKYENVRMKLGIDNENKYMPFLYSMMVFKKMIGGIINNLFGTLEKTSQPKYKQIFATNKKPDILAVPATNLEIMDTTRTPNES